MAKGSSSSTAVPPPQPPPQPMELKDRIYILLYDTNGAFVGIQDLTPGDLYQEIFNLTDTVVIGGKIFPTEEVTLFLQWNSIQAVPLKVPPVGSINPNFVPPQSSSSTATPPPPPPPPPDITKVMLGDLVINGQKFREMLMSDFANAGEGVFDMSLGVLSGVILPQ